MIAPASGVAVRAPRVRFIANQPSWYGARSGYYAQLPRAFVELGHHVQTVSPRRGIVWRVAGKAWSTVWRLPKRQQTLTADEIRFHAGWIGRPGTTAVILAMEDHLPALRYWERAPRRLIGTLHFPRACWTAEQARTLKRLQSAVVLYRADLDFFSSLVGQGRVRFAYHGVDLDFFRPAEGIARDRPSLLCVGQFGREFDQLARVAPMILDRRRDATLDIVAAPHAQMSTALRQLGGHPRVRFLTGVSDDALLRLYQGATVLLMPMSVVGASNAIVEALACGLPIVTTDVGGIRDYGGGALFPVVPKANDTALVEEAIRLIEDEERQRAMSRSLRAFAERQLAWSRVAAEHWRCYQELTQ